MNPEQLSITALVATASLSAVVFFMKRQLSSYDKAKETTYDNTRSIMVIQTEILQLKADIARADHKADEIVQNYKASFKELNEKLDNMTTSINAIKITCAGRSAACTI